MGTLYRLDLRVSLAHNLLHDETGARKEIISNLRMDLLQGAGHAHHRTVCGVVDQPTHDFRDLVWEHHRFPHWRCFVRARVPRIRCGHCRSVRSADVPRARPNSGFTLSFEALQLHMCKQAPIKSVSDLMGFGDDRLWRVIAHYVPIAVSLEDLSRVRRIGID